MEKNLSDYLKNLNENNQKSYQEIKDLLLNLNEDILETFSYGMPTFKYKNKVVIHIGFFKNHIGIFGLPKMENAEIIDCKQGKGSLQIPAINAQIIKILKKICREKIKAINKNQNVYYNNI